MIHGIWDERLIYMKCMKNENGRDKGTALGREL